MDKGKILIVENEKIIAKDLELILMHTGYKVLAKVSSGEEAVEFAIKNRPDLILMDIVLQGEIDGVEAVEKIHKLFDIPVIYLTAHTEESILERAKMTAPYGYLIKPVDPIEVNVAVDTALQKHLVERKRKELIDQLALERIRELEGCLSICASCKRIRDIKGQWEQLESYISQHSKVKFSHGLCPVCARATREEIQKYQK